jgi:type II secretory pathway pseudopilin PulG
MKQRRPFTLIELLVVISIIIVLAGLIMAALGGAQRYAQRVKAKQIVNGMALAIKQYETTYAMLPVAIPSGGDIVAVSDYSGLLDVLRGGTAANTNARKLPFISPTKTSGTTAYYQDPWGNNLIVVVSAAGRITANSGPSSNLYEDVNGSVAVWSKGLNKTDDGGKFDPSSNKDDINSWR